MLESLRYGLGYFLLGIANRILPREKKVIVITEELFYASFEMKIRDDIGEK